MEINRPKLAAKKLWSLLRLAFFLFKKSLISKTNLIADFNLTINKIRFIRKPITNLFLLHHHHSPTIRLSKRGGDYEFSCSNSPNSLFSGVRARLFPCIGSPLVIDTQNAVALLPKSPDDQHEYCDYGAGEVSPAEESDGGREGVDDDAEEFIRRFYQQLRTQTTTPLLRY